MADAARFTFGGLLWDITLGQFTAKVAGALLFSLLIATAYQHRSTA